MQHAELAPHPFNPFALMLDPAAIFQALEGSERLGRLASRVCKPLDKPLIPKVSADVAAFDELVDSGMA